MSGRPAPNIAELGQSSKWRAICQIPKFLSYKLANNNIKYQLDKYTFVRALKVSLNLKFSISLELEFEKDSSHLQALSWQTGCSASPPASTAIPHQESLEHPHVASQLYIQGRPTSPENCLLPGPGRPSAHHSAAPFPRICTCILDRLHGMGQ